MLEEVFDPRPPAITDPAGAAVFASHEVISGDPARGLVIVCDHARNALPPGYGTLGLPAGDFERHIAYDIGVEAVARGLCARLGVPAVLAGFSRLIVDPNRGLDDPTLIMQISDGTIVPGNIGLTPVERERRIGLYYRPYHAAIDRLLDGAMAIGRPPAMLSIHSFTPTWRGVKRPWHGGVLWNRDGRFALPLIERLRRNADLVIGDNEPYCGGLAGDTLDVHATGRGLADALIEIRQDLVSEKAGVAEWAARLAELLPGIIDGLDAATAEARGLTGVSHDG
jgi:predicted N-formylglutamate amidohydrolase